MDRLYCCRRRHGRRIAGGSVKGQKCPFLFERRTMGKSDNILPSSRVEKYLYDIVELLQAILEAQTPVEAASMSVDAAKTTTTKTPKKK